MLTDFYEWFNEGMRVGDFKQEFLDDCLIHNKYARDFYNCYLDSWSHEEKVEIVRDAIKTYRKRKEKTNDLD